jgi:hypothetical protein
MEALPAHLWKHTTAQSLYELDEEKSEVHVFDDEGPGMLSLYLSDGQKRWPARTIGLADIHRALSLLTFWTMRHGPLIDLRQDKSIPLPT